jgi:signal transduction histidine kinase
VKSSWRVVGVALLPLLGTLLVLWSWQLPQTEVLSLTGAWRAQPVEVGAPLPVAPAVDDTGWREVPVPGLFSEAGLDAQEVLLRRTVALPESLQGQNLLLALDYMRDAVVRVFVNGREVGTRGVYATGFYGSDSEVTPIEVPRELVTGPTVLVALEVKPNPATVAGVADGRLVLGRYDALRPWVFRLASVRVALELGALLSLSFLLVVVLVLWWLQGGRVDRPLYLGTLGLTGAVALYLVSTTGFLVSAVLSPAGSVKFIDLAVMALGLSIPEFIEAYVLGRVTRARQVNRVVSGLTLLACVVAWPLSAQGPELLYEGYSYWLFLLMAYSLALTGYDVVTQRTRFGPLLFVATIFTVLVGVNDLLGDMNVLHTPRFFSLGITNLGVCAVIVVLGEFLQMAQDNRRLTRLLGAKHRELEMALVQAEESARARSAFLANTSHELRTPLNAIINVPLGLAEGMVKVSQVGCEACGARFELEEGEAWTDALRCAACGGATRVVGEERRLDVDGPRLERLLTSVAQSGQHLLEVVNGLLDVSTLEAESVTLRREPVRAAQLLSQLELILEPMAQRAGVKLVVTLPPPTLELQLDRVKVSQVLMNLGANAIKFSDGKGTVEVRAEVVPGAVEFRVRDEGIGIAPEHHAVIFEGYRQVEAGARRFGGTGLGLAISRKLAELHGGALVLESALGQGSTFILRLPTSA